MVEVVAALAIVLLTSVSMVFGFTSTSLNAKNSDRVAATNQALHDTIQILDDQPFEELLSWDGVTRVVGNQTVTVGANAIEVGLVLVELVVTDQRTGQVLGRTASYRAGDL